MKEFGLYLKINHPLEYMVHKVNRHFKILLTESICLTSLKVKSHNWMHELKVFWFAWQTYQHTNIRRIYTIFMLMFARPRPMKTLITDYVLVTRVASTIKQGTQILWGVGVGVGVGVLSRCSSQKGLTYFFLFWNISDLECSTSFQCHHSQLFF